MKRGKTVMSKLMLLFCFLPLLLTGCIEDQKGAAQCFELIASEKDVNNSIMINKCTGESWLLVRVTITKEKDQSFGTFTYQWFPLSKSFQEPMLSYGFDDKH